MYMVIVFTLGIKISNCLGSWIVHILILFFILLINIDYCIMIRLRGGRKFRIVLLRWWIGVKNKLKLYSLIIILWLGLIRLWARLPLKEMLLLKFWHLDSVISLFFGIYLTICFFRDWSEEVLRCSRLSKDCCILKFICRMVNIWIWDQWIMIVGAGKLTIKLICNFMILENTSRLMYISIRCCKNQDLSPKIIL